jgi:hypothetical protein
VASGYENNSFRAATTLVRQVNPFEFQGTKSKSQYAALLDMSMANPDMEKNSSYSRQGQIDATQTNGRLELLGRANINSPNPLEFANGKLDANGVSDGSDGYI